MIHRTGPGREFEKLHGPYASKSAAKSRMLEYIEHFVRENSIYNPMVTIRRDDGAVISVEGLAAKGEGPLKSEFIYRIKPITAA